MIDELLVDGNMQSKHVRRVPTLIPGPRGEVSFDDCDVNQRILRT